MHLPSDRTASSFLSKPTANLWNHCYSSHSAEVLASTFFSKVSLLELLSSETFKALYITKAYKNFLRRLVASTYRPFRSISPRILKLLQTFPYNLKTLEKLPNLDFTSIWVLLHNNRHHFTFYDFLFTNSFIKYPCTLHLILSIKSEMEYIVIAVYWVTWAKYRIEEVTLIAIYTGRTSQLSSIKVIYHVYRVLDVFYVKIWLVRQS